MDEHSVKMPESRNFSSIQSKKYILAESKLRLIARYAALRAFKKSINLYKIHKYYLEKEEKKKKTRSLKKIISDV